VSNIQASNLPEQNATGEVELQSDLLGVQVVWDPSVLNPTNRLKLPNHRIAEAVRAAALHRGYRAGEIGVRITDDATIHQINAQFLSHDYPTDVISFPYVDRPDWLEGELIASVDTAAENAADAGWDTGSELLLYVIHGVLHIGGMDDQREQDRAAMRDAEHAVMTRLGMGHDSATGGNRGG
jgi:probable rRNA maturation factor